MSKAQFHDAILILDVRSVDRALAYYQRLGFKVDFRYPEDPDNYAGIVRGDVHLHMQWQAEEEFKKGTAGNLRVLIRVDDARALYEEYKAAGVLPADVMVRDTDWDTREFAFRDPDGNGLTFSQAL
jgi:catechol 2,3-dioxygenase-like lactoylglutathione lyase family enzyme